MTTEDIIGTWAKPRKSGEFSVMITALYLHRSGRAARAVFSYKPFTTLNAMPPALGSWRIDAGKVVVRFDGDSIPFVLTYIPQDQMIVDYNGDKQVHKRLTDAEASLTIFNLTDDPTPIIQRYLETGETPKL